jgi:general secretion pathway protein D
MTGMGGIRFIAVVVLVVTGISFGQSPSPPSASQPSPAPPLPCSLVKTDVTGCEPTKEESKEAKGAFATGLKLRRAKHMQEAFEAFDRAAQLVPQNVEYVTARELVRQQLVFDDLQQGDADLSQDRQTEALASFRGALQLDPKNDFAQQRIRDVAGEWAPAASAAPRILQDAGVPRVEPDPLRASFHYRGNGNDLLTQVCRTFGLTVTFDESVVSRPVRFDIDDVDFYQAMRAAAAVTHTFWTPLQQKQILVALDSAENHRKFDRLAMRTFYVPGVTTPADLSTIVTLLRNLFDIRLITPQAQAGTITIRAPQDVLEAATRVLEGLDNARPEIVLDLRVYQVDHMFMRNMGLQIPNQFQLFNIPAGALLALGGQNIQSLINQLISSGGINQANSQGISALLAQLQGQQSSIFSQPLATFGNGTTLMGVSLGTLGAQLSMNESWLKDLENVSLRASQGEEATMRMGSKYPVINASFAPIYNSSAISKVIQNNGFQAPFPSFSYEDLGVTLKAKASVNSDSAVSLHLEMQLRTLAGQSFNGVPVIANREFQGSMTLREGEPAVVAGAVTRSEQRSMNGIPGLGDVPGLNQVMASNSKQEEEDELLIVLTPHVISQSTRNAATEVWLPD